MISNLSQESPVLPKFIFYGQNIEQKYPKSFRICFLMPPNPFPHGFPWANCGNPMPQRKSYFQKVGFALVEPANGPKSGFLPKMGQNSEKIRG